MPTGQPVVINLCGDWTSATVDVALLVVTILSVVCAFCAYWHQKARNKKDAACSLAKHYADSVISKYSDIFNVYIKTGISDDVKKLVDIADIKKFNCDEVARLTEGKEKEYEQLIQKIQNIDPWAILDVRLKRCSSVKERDEILQYYVDADNDGNKSIKNGHYLQCEFGEEIVELLNELEWFSMSCCYRLADEKLLYQSLHQTFLSTVWILYFHISRKNTNNEDKLYTNISGLFVKWRDRLLKITRKKEKRKQKLLIKANAIEGRLYSGKPL